VFTGCVNPVPGLGGLGRNAGYGRGEAIHKLTLVPTKKSDRSYFPD